MDAPSESLLKSSLVPLPNHQMDLAVDSLTFGATASCSDEASDGVGAKHPSDDDGHEDSKQTVIASTLASSHDEPGHVTTTTSTSTTTNNNNAALATTQSPSTVIKDAASVATKNKVVLALLPACIQNIKPLASQYGDDKAVSAAKSDNVPLKRGCGVHILYQSAAAKEFKALRAAGVITDAMLREIGHTQNAMIHAKWKAMSAEEQKPWQELCDCIRARYFVHKKRFPGLYKKNRSGSSSSGSTNHACADGDDTSTDDDDTSSSSSSSSSSSDTDSSESITHDEVGDDDDKRSNSQRMMRVLLDERLAVLRKMDETCELRLQMHTESQAAVAADQLRAKRIKRG